MFHSMTLDICPVGKARPIVTRRGITYTPKKTRDFTNQVKALAKLRWAKTPITGSCSVSVVFNLPRPASVSSRKRPWPCVKPDLDNLLKAIFDALNGICWKDDSQIVSMTAEKRYAAEGSVWIAVAEY